MLLARGFAAAARPTQVSVGGLVEAMALVDL
jgi:hypothetical protein